MTEHVNSYLTERDISLKRNSNIELCRILCMILIIAHHLVVHGGSISIAEKENINKIISFFLIPGGKLGFDCFLAISSWFLVEQSFKTKRFLKVWLQVLFYSVTFSFVACLFGTDFSLTAWLSVFLPITGNSHGFAASYLAFYLMLPFLKRMTDNLNKKQARWLLFILVYFEVISQIIGYINQYRQPISSELFLFILCYVISLNLRKWPINICSKKWLMLGIYYAIWYILFMAKYLFEIYPENSILAFLVNTMYDESSITNLIGGYAFFFFFLNMKERKKTFINFMASGTFGILLFHDHNFFRYILWKNIFKAETWYYHKYFICIVICIVTAVYIIGFLIDKIRILIIENPLFKNKTVLKFCERCDSIINAENKN